MKVVILYRPRSEYARQIETFIRDFERQHDATRLEVLDVDSRDGMATASLYDIMRYPAILALATDGQLLKYWEGGELPLMEEVAYYTYAGSPA
jgi:hypothetical protein